MTSFMALDGVTSFLRFKDVTIACKSMWHSLSIGGSSSVQWWTVRRSWRLWVSFRRLLCVRIEIDKLQCVNCWVIIHCLSVSCTKINHERSVSRLPQRSRGRGPRQRDLRRIQARVETHRVKSLALRARDLIFFTTDLQTVNYYSIIHCWSWSFFKSVL